jgi:hypothetical protein
MTPQVECSYGVPASSKVVEEVLFPTPRCVPRSMDEQQWRGVWCADRFAPDDV